MKKNITLVIMAAGMGSRFGGLKQIEPVGPSGEIIADYSVFDAVRAGFKKVVFIIRRENFEYFKEHITNKFASSIEVDFAFQELDVVPDWAVIPEGREKMLGTAHTILCAKDKIEGDFVIINADDFYGANSFKQAYDFLNVSVDPNEYVSINYPFNKTSSKNGKVKRGVVETDNEGYMVNTNESEIGYENGLVVAYPLSGQEPFEIDEAQPVSMNFFGFKQSIIPFLEEEFTKFLQSDIGLKKEFLIPDAIAKGLKQNKFKVKSVLATSKWMGITYKEDLEEVKRELNELIKRGEYPSNLWN